jgi:glycosyltransferase involved in cell wall biosynthesis
MQRVKHATKLPDRTSDPDTCEISFLLLFDGWPEDVERFYASVEKHLVAPFEVVVVDNPGDDDGSERIAKLDRVLHIPLRDRVGYGAGRNIALRQATGRVVCIVDTSVEVTDDPLPVLSPLLDDPSIGLVGKWGVSTDHGFHFEESDGPDVDGVEAYFMGQRRADVERIGFFVAKFRFYRNADLDYSFKVRDAGLRTVVDARLPLVRHEHRLWSNTPEHERDDLSRKNFFRFRDHWADRPDLFTLR